MSCVNHGRFTGDKSKDGSKKGTYGYPSLLLLARSLSESNKKQKERRLRSTRRERKKKARKKKHVTNHRRTKPKKPARPKGTKAKARLSHVSSRDFATLVSLILLTTSNQTAGKGGRYRLRNK
jgi:hypothetical protein